MLDPKVGPYRQTLKPDPKLGLFFGQTLKSDPKKLWETLKNFGDPRLFQLCKLDL